MMGSMTGDCSLPVLLDMSPKTEQQTIFIIIDMVKEQFHH